MLGILAFESGPLVSLLLRITAVKTCLVAATVCEFVHGRPVRNARISCFCRCDERTHVNTCVNKSLVQVLESCPSSDFIPCTCCSANFSTFSRENLKSAGLVSAYMDSQKLDAILREPCSYYGRLLSQNGLRRELRASNF